MEDHGSLNLSSTGDYSMLVRQLDKQINGTVTPSPLKLSNPCSNSIEIFSKRKRLSISIDDDGSMHTSFPTVGNFSDSAKLHALIDELRLENEHTTEKLKSSMESHEREKDKLLRQLDFLDTENNQLRQAYADRNEKYYEEKKIWLSKQRELEADREKIRKVSSSSSSLLPSSAKPPEQDQYLATKLNKLEEGIKSKSKEVKDLSITNAALEETVKKLESQLLAVRSTSNSSSSEEINETRALRKQVSELEVQLRRTARENEKHMQKVKNQNLLNNEIAALAAKLKASEMTVVSLQSMETTNRMLQNEKDEWNMLFKDVLYNSNDSKLKAADITPVAAFRLLSTSQNRCAVFLKTQSDLEASLSDVKKRLEKAQLAGQEAERLKTEAQYSNERAENKLKLAQQQTKLYEKEVKNLRALLQSYDAEYKIGKPSPDEILKSKESLVEDLRFQLDDCRAQSKSLVDSCCEFENKFIQVPTLKSLETSADSLVIQNQREEIMNLRHQVQRGRDELYGLQKATGMDFVPSQTKVLHFVNNPSAIAGATSKGGPKFASTLEELRNLREENRRLQDIVLQRTSTLDDGDSTNNSGTDQTSSHGIKKGKHDSDTSVIAGDVSIMGGPDSNKMNQRLKEMFKERITCFREAVYLLTGYKIDLYSADSSNGGHPRLRLRSVYAEHPDDSLLFQWRGTALELIETPFAGKIDPRLFSMLSVSNSVPAFLSNVTLELFESQTFMG